ncbi:MAG: hypothetical protein ACRDNE_06430 [Gaiellaceae bacterium]
MDASEWDWTRIVVDHIDVHASNYAESVRFYETVLTPVGIPRIGQSNEGTCFTTVNVIDPKTADDESVPLFPREVAGAGERVLAAGLVAGFRSNGARGLPRLSTWLLRCLSPRSGRQQR